MRCAYEVLRLAHTTLVGAQRRYNQARAHERQYDSGVSGGVRLWPFPGLEPQLRLAERYESAWAILAWMTTHGPVGNLPARNELAALYYASLSQWDRFQTHRPREGEEQRWPTPRWQHYLQDVGPLEQHYLRDVYQHYLQDVGPH